MNEVQSAEGIPRDNRLSVCASRENKAQRNPVQGCAGSKTVVIKAIMRREHGSDIAEYSVKKKAVYKSRSADR